MTIRLGSIALSAVLLGTSPLSAGPIGWTYSTNFSASLQPSVPYIYVSDIGPGVGNSSVLEAALFSIPSGPGGQFVALGHFEPRLYNPSQAPPTYTTTFELDATITDSASGKSGVISLLGFGQTSVTPSWTPGPLSLELFSTGPLSLVLGNNRYDMRVNTTSAMMGGNGDVIGAVTITPVATPEPATFALAGVGLVAAFGARLRRRRTH